MAETSRFDFLAHHEAGHAAVAFSFGLRLEQVRIEPDDNSGGMTLTGGAYRSARISSVC